ncbi:MAG: hypothetical protein EBR75_05255, partial [Actinobacteria bacterium]|nr:hypothetical protein [Actinomycetota bacterium]
TTVYATWTPVTYAITYNGNGNTSGATPTNGAYTSGSTAYTVLGANTLAKTGYDFSGWNTAADGSGANYAAAATYSTSANLNLFAKWTLTNYTVTYSLNNATAGTLPTQGTKTIGQTFQLAAATGITKTGFTFGGWSDGTNTYTAGTNYTVGSANVTLSAVWIATYIITYDKNGATAGSAPALSSYVTGATGITLPGAGDLLKSGYVFAGWSTTPTGSAVSTPYTVSANTTLYAKWSLASINISFAAGTANSAAASPVTLPLNTTATFGSLYQLPNSSTVSVTAGGDVYVFSGWSDAATTYQPGSQYRVTATAPTFTAQWNRVYDVRYVLGGGTSTDANIANTDQECIDNGAAGLCTNGQVITTSVAPTRTGYDFAGWVDQGGTSVNAASSYTVSDGHYILYATWTFKPYNITFSAQTGSGAPATQTGNMGQIVSLSATAPTPPAGQNFIGWNTAANGSGSSYGAGAQLILGSSDVTLYAQYAAATITVIYAGLKSSGSLPAAQSAASGSNIQLAAGTGFARTGYNFAGWSDGSQVIAASSTYQMPLVNTQLTAQWTVALPNTPAAPTAVVGDASAVVTVNPGTGSGGDAVSYTITASPGGASCTVYAPATTCTISPLTNNTAYTFTTTATNATGTTSASPTSSSVKPLGKPDAPSSVVATASNGAANVSFAAPANVTDSAPTKYTITSSPAGGSCVLNSPLPNPLACNVTGLTNGTAYTFTVIAENALFISDTSTASVAVTPKTIPGAPSVSAVSGSPGTATVTVTAPASNGGSAITGYTITSAPGGFTCTVAPSANPLACDISTLVNGTSYTFTAVATNIVGDSVASSATSSVTPAGLPSAPAAVVAVPGDGKVTLNITPGAANGAAITGYEVTVSPDGTVITLTSAPYEITGLTNESLYTFSVKAINSVGTGSSATVSNSAKPKAVISPTVVTSIAPTGDEEVGKVLTRDLFFTGAPTPSVTYQWVACTSASDLSTCVDIAGATNTTFTLTSSQIGKYIAVKGTASNAGGTIIATSPTTDLVTAALTIAAPNTGINGTADSGYSMTPVTAGGTSPKSFAITSGTLPTGLNFDPTTGEVSGTPTAAGTSTITIAVTGGNGVTATLTLAISIAAAYVAPA